MKNEQKPLFYSVIFTSVTSIFKENEHWLDENYTKNHSARIKSLLLLNVIDFCLNVEKLNSES